jgi:hypothetical protein
MHGIRYAPFEERSVRLSNGPLPRCIYKASFAHRPWQKSIQTEALDRFWTAPGLGVKKIGTLGLETKEQVKEQSHQRNAKHATFLSGLVDRKSKHATLCFLRRAHVLILCLQIPSMSTGNFCLVPFAFVWSRLVPFDSVWLRLGVSVRISGKRSPIMAVVASGNKLYLNKKKCATFRAGKNGYCQEDKKMEETKTFVKKKEAIAIQKTLYPTCGQEPKNN